MDKLLFGELFLDTPSDEIAINAGPESGESDVRPVRRCGAVDNLIHRRSRHPTKTLQTVRQVCTSGQLGEEIIKRLRSLCRVCGAGKRGISALHYGASEELVVAATICCEVKTHRACSGAFAPNCHFFWVSYRRLAITR